MKELITESATKDSSVKTISYIFFVKPNTQDDSSSQLTANKILYSWLIVQLLEQPYRLLYLYLLQEIWILHSL